MSPAHFLFPSRMVSFDPEIRDYTRESFSPGRPVLDAAIELIHRLKADIVYAIGATTVTTMPPMSFALRRGVCQDFAHIMISGLRGIGLPAAMSAAICAPRRRRTRRGCKAAKRCMPGFCYGAAPSFPPRKRGRAGRGLDWARSTNAILAAEEHVTLAIGRDYTDVAPVDGVILGSGGQRMGVSVNVTPVQ